MPPQRKSKPRSPELAALGEAIELVIAKQAGMTPDSVSAKSGLDMKQVGDLIRGQGNPTYVTLLKLCRGLRTRPGKLLSIADELQDKT